MPEGSPVNSSTLGRRLNELEFQGFRIGNGISEVYWDEGLIRWLAERFELYSPFQPQGEPIPSGVGPPGGSEGTEGISKEG